MAKKKAASKLFEDKFVEKRASAAPEEEEEEIEIVDLLAEEAPEEDDEENLEGGEEPEVAAFDGDSFGHDAGPSRISSTWPASSPVYDQELELADGNISS